MSDALQEVLKVASAEGFLTPTAAAGGVEHSRGFLRTGGATDFQPPAEALALDLGSGGGLPGLVLAGLTACRWVLLDRATRRCTFLTWAVRELGLEGRVEVLCSDAVEAGRGSLRGSATLVTARGFAGPAVTAECAAPFLASGGSLVVSEPPDASPRWPVESLELLGLSDTGSWRTGSGSYRALAATGPCPEVYPRRHARQVADPLF